MAELKRLFFFYQTGTTLKRRNAEIRKLNDLYVEIVPKKLTLQKYLKHLCHTKPYRMLCDWSYENEPAQVQDDEQKDAPDFTDVN